MKNLNNILFLNCIKKGELTQQHEVIGEKTIADAILDRIVHNAHRLEMEGESMRKSINKKKILEN